jgi:hypothetical protein
MGKSDYYDANKCQSLNAEFIDLTDVQIIKDELSPESKLIKSESFQKLSGEAKEVISLILFTPSELIGVITTPKGEKSKKLLIKYLEKRWKSKFLVSAVIDEIVSLVKLF